jgi:N-acetylmuramoyl-L-alanine amidase
VTLLPAWPGLVSAQEYGGERVVTMQVSGELYPVRAFTQERRTYFHLGDIADAVGGSWGRDPLSRDPLFTLGENRVLFSSKDRRIAVNGRRRRLSAKVEFRHGGIYVPSDFVPQILEELLDQDIKLLAVPPPPPPPPDELVVPEPPAPSAGAEPGREPGLPWSDDRDREGRGVRTVVLDPGHGGEEEGAKGPTGLLEKDLVLDVARRLQQQLDRRGFQLFLTRERDKNIPLEERTAIANNRKADLFISLHANASPSPEASGAETYYLSLPRAAKTDAERLGGHETAALISRPDEADPLQMILWDMAQSQWLAESSVLAERIQADFNETLGIPDRGVKQAPFRILVGATMPAILVEIGFISNRDEERRLRDPRFLDTIVDSLSRSIDAYRARSQDSSWGRGDP